MRPINLSQIIYLGWLTSHSQAGTTSCQQTCTELSATFGNALYYPENDPVKFWDQKQQLAGQACRVEPAGPEEVAKVLEIVIKNACSFAIKGGGHSRELNDSNAPGGVTIDTLRMRKVELADDKSSVTLGAGHNVNSTLEALTSLKLIFPLGRISTIGLAGFLLGGGQGDMSGKYGFGMDNVYKYEVCRPHFLHFGDEVALNNPSNEPQIVLANGTITTASETKNRDLFWALRGGGGNNFGIVTAFTIRAIPETTIWAADSTHPDNQTIAVTEEIHKLVEASTVDSNVNFLTDYRFIPDSGDFTFTVRQRYLNATRSPTIFDGLNALSPAPGTLRSPNVAFPVPDGSRQLFVSLSWHSSAPMLQRAASIFKMETLKVRNVTGLFVGLDSQPITVSAIQAAQQRGGNSFGLCGDKPLLETIISIGWANAEDDGAMYAFADTWLAQTEAATRELGVYHPYRYMNHAFRSRQDVLGSYGKANLARLRKVQRSVDPNAVFTSKGLCTGYWKLL